jgi:C-terminal processing protease CtpA/Prc
MAPALQFRHPRAADKQTRSKERMMTRSTNAIPVLVCVVLAGLAIHSGAAAQVRMMGPDGENDVVMLGELGVVAGVMPGDEQLSVITLLPDADPDLEVKRGDLLLMVDGERVRDVAALRAAYEATEIGSTVKVGFRRGDERFLASFEREQVEHGERRVVMIGGPGHDMGDMQPVHEFGVILGEEDGDVVVSMELPMDEVSFKKGDIVKSINGLVVASLADFRGAYESLDVGTEIALVVARGGDEVAATRSKSDGHPGMRIRRGP